jgi:ubiquinone/menaquinone biosynthesis C-methylase UbiE
MNPWNLTPKEWADVLLKGNTPEKVADDIKERKLLPWSENLLQYTEDSKEVLDLGCGAGQHSALLACNGRKMTLLDISQENLDFSWRVFEILGLNARFLLADMTRPLPLENNSFDSVFSIGVFEYFSDKEIKGILKEAFRVSRKRVIIMVPNAFSIAYRLGYWYSKKTKQWVWGGERPFYTLKAYFKSIENTRFFEFTVAPKHSLNFLTMPKSDLFKKMIIRALTLKDDSNPALFRQGYLLISIGEKT